VVIPVITVFDQPGFRFHIIQACLKESAEGYVVRGIMVYIGW